MVGNRMPHPPWKLEGWVSLNRGGMTFLQAITSGPAARHAMADRRQDSARSWASWAPASTRSR